MKSGNPSSFVVVNIWLHRNEYEWLFSKATRRTDRVTIAASNGGFVIKASKNMTPAYRDGTHKLHTVRQSPSTNYTPKWLTENNKLLRLSAVNVAFIRNLFTKTEVAARMDTWHGERVVVVPTLPIKATEIEEAGIKRRPARDVEPLYSPDDHPPGPVNRPLQGTFQSLAAKDGTAVDAAKETVARVHNMKPKTYEDELRSALELLNETMAKGSAEPFVGSDGQVHARIVTTKTI